ncbi:MAG: electron transport complex subunit RsxG [Methyloprofundus sp.]|nr:electron transport complex subunit RsxG [Methyloprofundus sp.]
MPTSTPLSAAVRLACFSFIIIGLVSFVFHQTKNKIIDNEREALLQSLQSVLPKTLYDNIPSEDLITLKNHTIYRAYQKDTPVAAIIKSTTTQGYSGNIQLLTALDITGTILDVRILDHKETPGLGDKIELKKSNWILGFQHKTLAEMQQAQWAVKRDQGSFDQFTGATITPRAVVNEVKKIGLFFQQYKLQIFPQLK